MSIKSSLNPRFLHAIDIGSDNVDMVTMGSTVYILKADGLLDIYDARISRKTRRKSFVKLEGPPKNIFIDENRLYTSSERSGVLVYSLDKPLKPVLLTKFSINPPKFYNAVTSWDNKIVASVRDFENEVHILDKSDPENIKLIGSRQLEWIPKKIVASKNTIIVPEGVSGAELLWGANPAKMKVIGSIRSGIDVVKVWDSFIAMSFGDRLYIFSVP